jgi:hypothetical protein
MRRQWRNVGAVAASDVEQGPALTDDFFSQHFGWLVPKSGFDEDIVGAMQ